MTLIFSGALTILLWKKEATLSFFLIETAQLK